MNSAAGTSLTVHPLAAIAKTTQQATNKRLHAAEMRTRRGRARSSTNFVDPPSSARRAAVDGATSAVTHARAPPAARGRRGEDHTCARIAGAAAGSRLLPHTRFCNLMRSSLTAFAQRGSQHADGRRLRRARGALPESCRIALPPPAARQPPPASPPPPPPHRFIAACRIRSRCVADVAARRRRARRRAADHHAQRRRRHAAHRLAATVDRGHHSHAQPDRLLSSKPSLRCVHLLQLQRGVHLAATGRAGGRRALSHRVCAHAAEEHGLVSAFAAAGRRGEPGVLPHSGRGARLRGVEGYVSRAGGAAQRRARAV
ncbi:hypothetical protein FGB62_91g14 [Gracilaria domingensis]|nr:hypothetical protein FGB62_91g14 [Gracilaria domingensis]